MTMWVFGYGSIIWKTDFEYTQSVIGYIEGFKRKFYQLSTDHRGTSEQPGRVVTLIPSFRKQDRVWGVAFEIRESTQKIFSALDKRECGGYIRKPLRFHPHSVFTNNPTDQNCELLTNREPFEVITYIADIKNEYFSLEIDPYEISKQIAKAKGLSGFNIDYIRNLERSIRDISKRSSHTDEHLFTIYSFLVS